MDSVSFKFYLSEKPSSGDKLKIYGRLTINRRKAEFYTNFSCEKENWNEIAQKPKNDFLIEQELADIKSKVFKIRRSFIDQEIEHSPRDVIDILKDRGNKQKGIKFTDYYANYTQELIDMGNAAISSIRQHKGSLILLNRFYSSTKCKSIYVKDLDYTFVKKMEYYMNVNYVSKYGTKIQRNTINKHHKRFSAIINLAIKDELIEKNPYKKFKFKNEKTVREYLTLDELAQMAEANLGGNKSLEKVRDIFLFTCNTGVRFQDSQNLKMDNILLYNEGKKYLSFKMEKTSEMIMIPLTNQALDIIEKYSTYPDRLVQNSILPKISNQKFNSFIKVVAEMAAIEKKVSHHIARHTFATVALNKGIPITVVQKLLGHTSVKTTEVYAKLVDRTIFEQMKKME